MARKAWLNRNVFAMGLTSFFNDFGHEMTAAALPAFVTMLGGTSAHLGLIEGCAAVARYVGKALGGWLSDRMGKRTPLMNFGYLATALGVGSLGFATSWLMALLSRVAIWGGRGSRESARDALLLESSKQQDYGKTFGFHRAMDTAGAVVGPALAFALMPYCSFRTIFFIAFIPSFLSFVTVLCCVQDVEAYTAHTPLGLGQSLARLPLAYWLYLGAVGLFRLGNFASTLLILQATHLLTPALGQAAAGTTAMLLYAWRNAVYALGSFPLGLLADRFGRKLFLAFGYLLTGISAIGFMLSLSSLLSLVFFFTLAGIAIAFFDGLERAVAGDLLPQNVRGTGYGMLALVTGAGNFVASSMVGLLTATVSPFVGFGYSLLLCTAGALALVLVHKGR